jgi:peptide-methionine (R)-S-oxide reductase
MSDIDPDIDPRTLTEAEWRERLTPMQYHVLREAGRSAPLPASMTTPSPGEYRAGCGAPLFTSQDKFNSGCGWPAYSAPVEESALTEIRDTSHGMIRTEVRCARCEGHLGHVFPDGPGPTGLRYCINSAALGFEPGK